MYGYDFIYSAFLNSLTTFKNAVITEYGLLRILGYGGHTTDYKNLRL